MRRRHALKSKRSLLAAPYLVWSVAFIIIPLLMVFYYGFIDKDGGFTLEHIAAIAQPEHRKALWLSIRLSLVSTVICFLLAYPLAMILSRISMNQNQFIVLIFILPMWMNFLLRTLAWQTLLEKNGVINSVLRFFSLPTLNIINTDAAIILGMVYNFLPFMVLPIYNALVKIDENVIEAARDLGAGDFLVLRKIIMPLSLPGVISGITMVLVPSMSEFVIASMLGGGKVYMIGNVIEQAFNSGYADTHLGSGLSLSLMGLIVISMVIYQFFDRGEEGSALW